MASFGGFERDARIFLVTTLVSGAAISLYWIDFNLYLRSLGYSPATIGLIATGQSLAGAIVALPAGLLSDRIGRRLVIAAGAAVMTASIVGLIAFTSLPAILLLAACYGAGQQALTVVQTPFLTEHSTPEHRSELFAAQFAITNVTNIAAAVLGGLVAGTIAATAGLDPDGPGTYRIVLVMMAGLSALGLATLALLADDRPRGAVVRRSVARFGIAIADRRRFVRLLLPGFLISIGAGQVIPFLNLFVQQKFNLDLASLNAAFALTSLGTVVAILLQPALARRLGKIGSVVVVQAASIPFLAVLGFSPILSTVVFAMAIRNSLMNAGNPIFNAFAMEQVDPGERATLAAAMSLLWSLGWVIAGPWFSLLQATLGFEAGYAVNFITIIVLYTTATALYWLWFGRAERRERTTIPRGGPA